MMRLRFILLLLWLPASAHAQADTFKVARVINGKSFVLESGDTVRLASIEAPNTQEAATPSHTGRPGEPLGDEAAQALAALIMGKDIRIVYNPGTRDRHNRLLGQVYLADGTWVQGYMLRAGWAMCYSFTDDTHDIIEKMLSAEREAQKKKLGIWAHPYYRIITPPETDEFINRFKLVEGVIASVNVSHDNIYINFSEHWKGKFAVFISRRFAPSFAAMNLRSLVGRNVRVRGWIHYHNAPMIDITHPEQIEVE